MRSFDIPPLAMSQIEAIGVPEDADDPVISLPYGYTPRVYQKPLWDAMVHDGVPRGVAVWHRRAGKDVTCLNILIYKAFERVGTYYYCFPTFAQGKKIFWDGIGGDGRRYMDYIPAELIVNINHTEMKIELAGGSILQIIGVEQIDRLVGTNPVGLVFSEYSLQNPMAWELFRPILAENGGWALFEYTPRGHNHGYALYDVARRNPGRWFTSMLTVDQTLRDDGTRVVTQDAIDEERSSGMSEELIQQEFYCSFDAAVQGAYYGDSLRIAWKDGRVRSVPFDPMLPTFSSWDIGVDDSTSIWVFQAVGSEIRLCRYFEANGKGLPYFINFIKEIRDAQGFQWTAHFAPHDMKVREFTSGVSRIESARKLGLRFTVAKKLSISEGIDAVRRMFPRLYFDEQGCSMGLSALSEYTKDWDDVTKTFSDHPKHDWTSHAADALRTLAVAWRDRFAVPEHHRSGAPIIGKILLP